MREGNLCCYKTEKAFDGTMLCLLALFAADAQEPKGQPVDYIEIHPEKSRLVKT
jgi:hypothetical protein